MFDEETVNAFSGGYRVSEYGVVTLIGHPLLSKLKNVISFPISIPIDALIKRGKSIRWSGVNGVELPYESSRLKNDWFDPIKLVANISIQRGWKSAPNIIADERLNFQLSLGYYSAFVDLLIQAFSLANGVNLSTSELIQMSGEVQDKILGRHNEYETVTRLSGREGNLLLYDRGSNSYRNEMMNFEPFSLFLISENYLSSNVNFQKFQKNMMKFDAGKMLKSNPSSLSYPFVGMRNHFAAEEESYADILGFLKRNDSESFVRAVSKYSQSAAYNLGVISEFQRTMAKLLERYGVSNYIFNVGEHSGSLLVFADSLEISKIKDNTIRDYYNMTNRTIRFDEIGISDGFEKEQVRT